MDANRTRFHLLLGQHDWARCMFGNATLAEAWGSSPPPEARPGVAWDDARQELTLRPRLFRFIAARADVMPERDSRRGAAADRFGNVYWIDEDRRRIRVRSIGSGSPSDFWPCNAPPSPERHGDFEDTAANAPATAELSGLAVTQDHYLVAGTLAPEGLLIFDLFAGGSPTQLLWPIAFRPYDLAARPGGGVWVLDREHRCYWGLDRRFRVLNTGHTAVLEAGRTDTFQPAGEPPSRGIEEHRFPEAIEYDAASPVDAVDAIAIEALPDGTVLILDRDETQRFSRILRYRCAQRLGEGVTLRSMADLIEEGENAGFTLVAHDFAYLPATQTEGAQLFVASAEGNQAFAFSLTCDGDRMELRPLAKHLPMRRFGGKGLAVSGRFVYYDFGDTWIPLAVQRRPRYATFARIETRPDGFDSMEPDCVWHRLMLDACLPPDTSVEFWSRAANTPEALAAAAWQREPAPYRRGDGSELPWLRRRSRKDGSGARGDDRGTYELLFQEARGRFLQLRLLITGNERATPRLHALRLWYPRFSYSKNYLPAVYREDGDSASFLERFLANLEGVYTALEDRIAHVRALFHWESAPADALRWLAGWLGAVLDPAWDERRQRLFIEHAVHFYQYRGTLHGVRMALALALDPEVCKCALNAPGAVPESRQRYRIIERFRTRLTPGLALGEPLRNTGPREVEINARWHPREGGEGLSQRYREYLTAAEVTADGAAFDLVPPPADNMVSGGAESDKPTPEQWAQFAQAALGFVPSAADERRDWQRFLGSAYAGDTAKLKAEFGFEKFDDVRLPTDMPAAGAGRIWAQFARARAPAGTGRERRLWQDFLARRYGRIQALNDAYRTSWTGFDVVPLFDRLPADGSPLYDWYQFETVIKLMDRHAHRFTVLVPSAGPNADLAQVQSRLELARRVVELEKPVHTIFDVGFYWALFRTGEARLGFDTLIDVGSRAPELLPALVLGEHFVGSSHLALSCVRPSDQRMSLECLPVAT